MLRGQQNIHFINVQLLLSLSLLHQTNVKLHFLLRTYEKSIAPVFGTDVGHDVLVEELEDEWDTVGKHQVLGDDFKLQRKEEVAEVRRVRQSGKSSHSVKRHSIVVSLILSFSPK